MHEAIRIFRNIYEHPYAIQIEIIGKNVKNICSYNFQAAVRAILTWTIKCNVHCEACNWPLPFPSSSLHDSQYISISVLSIQILTHIHRFALKLRRFTWCLEHRGTALLKTSSLTPLQSLHYRFLSNVEVGRIYSTSLSSRAIGSALVDRLKLQPCVAPRKEKEEKGDGSKKRRKYRIKIERRRRDHGAFGSTSSLIDVDPIRSGLKSTRMIRGWYRQERRVLIRPARFQFLPVDLKEDASSSA